MDRKSITLIAICFVVLLLWTSVIVPWLYPSKPLPAGATNSVVETQTIEMAAAPATNVPAAALPVPAPAAAAVLRPSVNTNVPEELLVVTNGDARYTFTSYGGGLKQVDLVGYPEEVATHGKGQSESNQWATLNANAPAPVLSVLDGAGVEGDGIFSLSPTATGTGVRAEKTLTNGLTLVKEFTLSTNFLVNATVRLENNSSNSLSLPEQYWVVGTATPMSVEDSARSVRAEGLMWYDGKKNHDIIGASYFSSHGFMCTPRTPPAEFRGGETNVVWAGVHNQFFALVVMPEHPAPEVVLRKAALPPPTPEELQAYPSANKTPEGYEATMVYPALTLTPNQTVERRFVLFAGPKEYHTLARIADRFGNNVDLVMGYNGFFGFFSKALLLGMNGVHSLLRVPYGWSIVIITIIIKLAFWPLTQASTRSMKRMQALQPQMKALQAKYKDDPAKMNRKMMAFMKENKVSPLGGCLPMALQMPVFFGFYRMIQSAIELRGASFLWIRDLSRPDTLFIIPGTTIPFNLLPLIMGVTMLWQSHLTPVSPGVDPAQQKLMRYMPLIFLVILYNFSSGLTLYWTVNNLLTIAQTKLTKTQQATPAAPALTPPPKKRK